jgi:hypothetical protein
MRKFKYSIKNILTFFSLSLFLQSASANLLMIERFNMTEVDVSINGLDYSDTVNTSLLGELPIMIIDSNSEHLKIKLPDVTTVWVMESDVTTSEYSASANLLMIERFNMAEVDVSINGLDYSDTVNASLFGELPIMIIDSNSEYLKIKQPDGTAVWVMESDVTTSEYNEALRNCSIVQGGDMSLSSQGAVRGVDSTCQE